MRLIIIKVEKRGLNLEELLKFRQKKIILYNNRVSCWCANIRAVTPHGYVTFKTFLLMKRGIPLVSTHHVRGTVYQ